MDDDKVGESEVLFLYGFKTLEDIDESVVLLEFLGQQGVKYRIKEKTEGTEPRIRIGDNDYNVYCIGAKRDTVVQKMRRVNKAQRPRVGW